MKFLDGSVDISDCSFSNDGAVDQALVKLVSQVLTGEVCTDKFLSITTSDDPISIVIALDLNRVGEDAPMFEESLEDVLAYDIQVFSHFEYCQRLDAMQLMIDRLRAKSLQMKDQ